MLSVIFNNNLVTESVSLISVMLLILPIIFPSLQITQGLDNDSNIDIHQVGSIALTPLLSRNVVAYSPLDTLVIQVMIGARVISLTVGSYVTPNRKIVIMFSLFW